MLKYWNTLRHLRPIQFYGRLWFRLARPKADLSPAPPKRSATREWIEPAERRPSMPGPDIFQFLNETGALSDIGWDGPERDKLWRYNQHYFDDLNAHDHATRANWHRSLLENWMEANPPASGAGWDPYPTSLRIVNWVKWALGGSTLIDAAEHSLAVQARWLLKRLEWHLLGNHLFANAKALIFAGLYFEGPEADRWLTKGFDILRREVPEQILDDGGHFELSTMYHAIALEDMLDITNLFNCYEGSLTPSQRALQNDWSGRIDDMLKWHQSMCHPDGEISFFNDAAFGITPSPSDLFSYANRLGFVAPPEPDRLTWLSTSGYVRLDAHNAIALLDVAPIGPDYLPGHAHADTLSFELSLFGSRVFVNSGTSVYGTGDERLRQRSTSAHNTVTVDGEDSSEVWSGFRVARRARPTSPVIEKSDDLSVECSHDGYSRLTGGPMHTRRWRLGPQRLQIEDMLSTQAGCAEAHFHLHPDVRASIKKDGTSGTLLLAGGKSVDWKSTGGSAKLEAATWHPEFGVTLPTVCLVITLRDGRSTLSLSWGK